MEKRKIENINFTCLLVAVEEIERYWYRPFVKWGFLLLH